MSSTNHYSESIPKRFENQLAGNMTLEQFLKKYRKGTSEVKYEWNSGVIEKSGAMKLNEQYILNNLQRLFVKTTAFTNGAMLTYELEVWTSPNQWRKPDAAYLTAEQIENGANNMECVPLFVVEVISKNDNINTVFTKVDEYFKAGVKVLWQIFPDAQMIQVFSSPKKMEVMVGNDVCSAEAVIQGFKLTVNEVFQRKGDNKSDN
jgi:Uma2 family endonuclease